MLAHKAWWVSDASSPSRPVVVGSVPLREVNDLAIAGDDDGRRLVVIPAAGPAQLLDFSDVAKPQLIATFNQPLWFLGTARLPGLLLKVIGNGKMIRVSAFGRSKTF